jgi:DNA sulfur modification protein DndC
VPKEAYVGTGCTGCPLTDEGTALDTTLVNASKANLGKLKGLKLLRRELRQPPHRRGQEW